jgi:phenylacetate-CoA ligase
MPVIAQHAMVTAYGLYWHRQRFGKHYRQVVGEFAARTRFTAAEWEQYTEKRLRDLLVLAFTRVPYYKEHWRGIVTLAQLERFTTRDLVHLPPLEKSTARDNPKALLVDGLVQKDHRVYHTSGSTGTPVAIYYTTPEHSASLAMRHTRYSAFSGVGYDHPRATFSGRMVEPNPDSKGPYYRFNAVERQVYFSAFHLSPATVPHYLAALRRHRTAWITGYSNSIYQLAQMTLDAGLDAPPMRAVITTSEKLTPEMRLVIEQAFRTRVHEEYASVEDLFFACDNEYGQMLVSPDGGLIEIVDDALRPLPNGEMGEVLVTGFIRPSQPMIRYRVGDSAALSDEPARCGRGMPVLKEVIGRIEDTIYGLDGRRMVRFHGIFVGQPHVREGQIIQEARDLIRVRVVPKSGYNEADTADIVHRVQQRLTDRMRVEVDLVEQIERTKAGKFRAVVSMLKPEDIPSGPSA